MRTARVIFAVVVLVAAARVAGAEPPRLKNGKVIESPMSGSLFASLAALIDRMDQPAWIGYAVDPKPGMRICGGVWHGKSNVAHLEDRDDGFSVSNEDADEMRVDRRLLVLLRVDHDAIMRMRAYTDDCPIDGGSRTLYWLGDADTKSSLQYLEGLVPKERASKNLRDGLYEQIVSGLAVHNDPDASAALERIYARTEDDELRSQVVFWIGQASQPDGLAFLQRALHEDPSSEVREQIIFAVSQHDSPGAVDALIDIARNDRDSELREKALFWLSQKAGEKSRNALKDAAINDPDQDVKEQAVFALSQLPEDEGIPLLIEVARTNPNAGVREKAIFWLGQSDDPRVLTFFEEILTH